jgi:hypothetical protein
MFAPFKNLQRLTIIQAASASDAVRGDDKNPQES